MADTHMQLWLVEIAIEPKSKPDQEKLSVALEKLAAEATPADCAGSVIGDLNARRGQLQGQDMRGDANIISAMVPLTNMFGYVDKLSAISQARATFAMQFDHYAQAPPLPDSDPPFRPAIGMRP